MSLNGRKVNLRDGFTLMELLVVIAIIALLVSILMPSLQAAKTLARLAVCQSTMHNLAMGNGQYMGDNDGFSVHGEEVWDEFDVGNPGNNVDLTGYDLAVRTTTIFDDDYGNSKRGVYTWKPAIPHSTAGSGEARNQMNNGGQNICSVGQLMWDGYIEESAAAIGCPQADFTEVTPFTGRDCDGHKPEQNTYQYVRYLMDIPKMEMGKTYSGSGPDDPNGDPNAYWRNEFFQGVGGQGNYWNNKPYVSNYVVRGPMFRSGDIRESRLITHTQGDTDRNARIKADSEIGIFADFEFANWMLVNLDPYGLPALGYNKPAYMYFPRRHTAGPVVGYLDGHAALVQDENRKKTWNRDLGKFQGNYTRWYGNGWALMYHIYDAR